MTTTTKIKSCKYDHYAFNYDGTDFITCIPYGATTIRLTPFDDHENWGKYPTAVSILKESSVERVNIVHEYIGEKYGEPVRKFKGTIHFVKDGIISVYPIVGTAKYILANETINDLNCWEWDFDYPVISYQRMATVTQELYIIDKTTDEFKEAIVDKYKFFINS
jgi:hypothetical protein